MDSSELESIEKLEQLRVLESGRKIALVEVESNSFGIDTQDDLIKARDLIK
jgi:3-deoxy-manno-octulosonate cytidylyltransferase (CMP-KDO synthetase)